MNLPVYQVKNTIFTALSLFIVDAFVMNQGAIAVITGVVIVLWLLPKSLVLKYKRESARVPLTKAAIYSIMVLLVFLANVANNKLAKYRAENLIVAIEKYHQETGHYPEKLNNLVPEYISNIPLAKYTLFFNKFRYINHKDTQALYYVELPPFGRPTYSFNRQSWGYID
ncbi:hypothetical protein [Sulfuriferula nivalis]|uniref:Type II secretion system protein GspG C-terminal domain-containing protein n=1 Tax=Sulfuriferula nivalis TaxID=2675298 RepID=A0A809RT66_9PROT|nr:hypothetical protein [Sulfuriferula nivalis]BBP02081.1 hypothetical protein SFSGTM_27890 [Sulfuriferula nivalis]